MIPLPALASARCGGVLVARRRGVLHVATPGAAGLTQGGRLRRGQSPICGQRGRSWPVVEVDGRPLCRRCHRQLKQVADFFTGIERRLLVEALAATLRTARDAATVRVATQAVVSAPHGVLGALVEGEHGYPVRMTQLVKTARERVERPATTAADHGWFSSVKNAPPRRFPRRAS